MGSQLKRPNVSRSDPLAQPKHIPMSGLVSAAALPPQAGAAPPIQPFGVAVLTNQKLTKDDVIVKAVMHKSPEKYNEFVEVIRDYKSESIHVHGVMVRVKMLFNGYPELILGFNAFLPNGHKIELQEEKKPINFVGATNFVKKIKNRFQHDEHVCKAFLDILDMYRKKNKSIQDVYQEVLFPLTGLPSMSTLVLNLCVSLYFWASCFVVQ